MVAFAGVVLHNRFCIFRFCNDLTCSVAEKIIFKNDMQREREKRVETGPFPDFAVVSLQILIIRRKICNTECEMQCHERELHCPSYTFCNENDFSIAISQIMLYNDTVIF